MEEIKQSLIEAQIKAPSIVLEDTKKSKEIAKLTEGLCLTMETLRHVQKVFIDEMNRGLADKPSSLQMENTYLPELPNGTESGQYLALDLGGTNFRVLLVELTAGEIVNEAVKHYHINDAQRVGCAVELFDYLAKCVGDFVCEQGLEDVDLPLGFTFSFPMILHSLKSGSLLTWTKSFKCGGIDQSKDIVQMLQDSLTKYGVNNVTVVALLNDTTGTVVTGARMDHRTGIGMIIGTGSNACYFENTKFVKHWEGGLSAAKFSAHHVVVDVEWGAFGDNGCLDFIKTPYDIAVDNLSLLTSSFTFEKYISGKYLGEVVRCVLEGLIHANLLLSTKTAKALLQPQSFTSANVSEVEVDNIEGTTWRTMGQMARLGIHHPSHDDLEIIKYVCALASHRAAQLISTCLSTLLIRMNWEHVTVAVDGSLYKYHPKLRHVISTITALLAPDHQFSLMDTKDGSGKGAALTAAVAYRLEQNRDHK